MEALLARFGSPVLKCLRLAFAYYAEELQRYMSSGFFLSHACLTEHSIADRYQQWCAVLDAL